jgi:hypothetical protein
MLDLSRTADLALVEFARPHRASPRFDLGKDLLNICTLPNG